MEVSRCPKNVQKICTAMKANGERIHEMKYEVETAASPPNF